MTPLSSTLSASSPSPWVALFGSAVEPHVLLQFMATDAVPGLDSPETGGALCDAFLARYRGKDLVLRLPATGGTIGINAAAFPAQAGASWPAPSSDADTEEAAAHVLGRLLTLAPLDASRALSALDVALHRGWVPVVRQLLRAAPELPSLSSLRANNASRASRDALPWLHQLTEQNRLGELDDWLSRAEIDASQRDRAGETALFRAATAEAVSVLVSAGTDPGATAHNGLGASASWASRRPTYPHGLYTPATVEQLRSALASAGHTPTAHSDIQARVTAWLSSSEKGPDLAGLRAQTLDELGTTRFQVASGKAATEWGVVAYMGLNLPYFGHHRSSTPDVEVWKRFLAEAPAEWLGHESTPGVPDGWVLAVGLNKQARFLANEAREHVLHLRATLLERLLPAGPPISPPTAACPSSARWERSCLTCRKSRPESRGPHGCSGKAGGMGTVGP